MVLFLNLEIHVSNLRISTSLRRASVEWVWASNCYVFWSLMWENYLELEKIVWDLESSHNLWCFFFNLEIHVSNLRISTSLRRDPVGRVGGSEPWSIGQVRLIYWYSTRPNKTELPLRIRFTSAKWSGGVKELFLDDPTLDLGHILDQSAR